MTAPAHRTRWEDDGYAGVDFCGDVDLGDKEIMLNEDTTRECPNCRRLLRLVWDVRVEVVE